MGLVTMVVSIEKIIEGDGKSYPKEGNMVEVHYQCLLPDGTVFDDTRKRDMPFRFRLKSGEVIKGWDEGVSQMSLGERAKITMTPDLAYGDRGFLGLIPPRSTIVFIV